MQNGMCLKRLSLADHFLEVADTVREEESLIFQRRGNLGDFSMRKKQNESKIQLKRNIQMREHTLFCQERFHARVWGYRWPIDFVSCGRNTYSTPSKQAGTGGRKELLRRGDKCRGREAIEISNTTEVSVLQDWRTLSSSHHGLLPRVFMGPCGEKQKGRWCCWHRAIHKKEMQLFLVVLFLSLWCWGWNLLARATSFYGYLLFQTLTVSCNYNKLITRTKVTYFSRFFCPPLPPSKQSARGGV